MRAIRPTPTLLSGAAGRRFPRVRQPGRERARAAGVPGNFLSCRGGSTRTPGTQVRRNKTLSRDRMIIERQEQVTDAVLKELARAPNARFREIMAAFVRHLHDLAREVHLTEEEFQAAVGYIVALGKHTTETHNEAVLISGSLGFSTLICLLNNGNNGQTETDANLLGPFWRKIGRASWRERRESA